MKNEIEMKN